MSLLRSTFDTGEKTRPHCHAVEHGALPNCVINFSAGELTKAPHSVHYRAVPLRNGSTMILITDHMLSAKGLCAQACACVSVAKKSKKQPLI